MATARRIGPKIGRNGPCPCGSGRKYKHCCLPKYRAEQRKVLEEQRAQAEAQTILPSPLSPLEIAALRRPIAISTTTTI